MAFFLGLLGALAHAVFLVGAAAPSCCCGCYRRVVSSASSSVSTACGAWTRVCLYLVLFLPLCVLANAALQNTWEYMTKAGVATYAAKGLYANATACLGGNGAEVICPEYVDDESTTVVMRSFTWRWSDDLVLKFFPDVLIFYGFLYALALLGVLSQSLPSVSRCLSRRVRCCCGGGGCSAARKEEEEEEEKGGDPHEPLRAVLNEGLLAPQSGSGSRSSSSSNNCLSSLLPATATVGSLVVGALFAVMLALTVTYWLHDHNYHTDTPKKAKQPVAMRVTRTLGQVANVLLGLLVLPVSRSSVWNTLLGVPWEVGMRVHVVR